MKFQINMKKIFFSQLLILLFSYHLFSQQKIDTLLVPDSQIPCKSAVNNLDLNQCAQIKLNFWKNELLTVAKKKNDLKNMKVYLKNFNKFINASNKIYLQEKKSYKCINNNCLEDVYLIDSYVDRLKNYYYYYTM